MRWFTRKQPNWPITPGHLNNVLTRSIDGQRLVGFVDDGASVYDLNRHYLGSVDSLAVGNEHRVTDANRQLVGSVDSNLMLVNGGYWHQVYDAAHQLVGLVDNGSEFVTTSRQRAGYIVYNEGNGGTGWKCAGAALLLLLS